MNLFDKHPIVLDKNIAKVLGLNEAIVLQQVHYWIEINKKAKRNCQEGRYWTYNTIEEWREEFPFWSKDTVKRTFKKLREMGLMIVGNFNTMKMDRTLWYSIDYEKLESLIHCSKEDPSKDLKSTDDDMENAPVEKSSSTPAIPETSTETTSEISNQSTDQEGEMDRGREYQRIANKIGVNAIDENYRRAVSYAIKLILIEIENSKRVKVGDNYIPTSMLRDDIENLDFFVIEFAVDNFKEACENYDIRNPIGYLKSCIYNAIYSKDISIDAKLRGAGLI